MRKHTQGPWHYAGKGWDGRTHEINNDNGTGIAVVPDIRLNAEANARLIAAAPELLDAAKLAVKFIEGMHSEDKDEIHAYSGLQTAIAKAEGK